MEYELMFLVGENNNSEIEQIKKAVQELVEKEGGKWTEESLEFERKLAYKIKHQWRGTYFVQRFTLPSKDEKKGIEEEGGEITSPIEEINRQMNLRQDILRYIVVRSEELPSLSEFAKKIEGEKKEEETILKEKGEKIDGKLEKALNI